jgi:hypothetical protein
LRKLLDATTLPGCLDPKIPHSDVVKSMIGLLCFGKPAFAPILAWIGRDGYQDNVELREGSQHSQKNTPAFLRETIKYAGIITDTNILARMAAGNDALDNSSICIEKGVDWLVKRNL